MSPRKKSGQSKTAQPKPVQARLVYNDKEISEGSSLHAAFTRLQALGERELAGTLSLLDIITAAGQTSRRLTQMQSQLDRMEGRILEILRGHGVKAAEVQAPAQQSIPADKAAEVQAPSQPSRKKKAAKPSHAAKASVAKELADLEETVEERQARMAKMERDEKHKMQALLKKQEKLKAKKEKEAATEPETEEQAADQEKPAQKKKPRRRRKTAKKETAPSPETAQVE